MTKKLFLLVTGLAALTATATLRHSEMPDPIRKTSKTTSGSAPRTTIPETDTTIALPVAGVKAPLESTALCVYIDPSEIVGTVNPISGVHGGPVSGAYDLSSQYAQAGIHLSRIPQDDGFYSATYPGKKYTLASIFPSSAFDADDPDGYVFATDCWTVAGHNLKMGDLCTAISQIKKAGGEVCWQATFDIEDGDFWEGDDSFQAGRAVQDATKWARVVYNCLRHFNEGWNEGHGLDVRYVEGPTEPFGLGGFDPSTADSRKKFWDTFKALADTVAQYNADYGRSVKILGPGLQSEGSGKEWLIEEFLDFVQAGGIKLDYLSWHGFGLTPKGQRDRAQTLQGLLDARGMSSTKQFASAWSGTSNASELVDKKTDAVRFNLIEGSYATATKIYWQGYVEEGALYRFNDRANRNQITPDTSGSWIREDGRPRPGYYAAFYPLKIAAEQYPNRVRTCWIEQDDLAVMGCRDDSGDKVAVILAGIRPEPIRVSLWISGVWAGQVYTVDENTAEWAASSTIGQVGEGPMTISIPSYGTILVLLERSSGSVRIPSISAYDSSYTPARGGLYRFR